MFCVKKILIYLLYFIFMGSHITKISLLYLPDITLDAGMLARSQYLEGPATGQLDTGFSWFPCV